MLRPVLNVPRNGKVPKPTDSVDRPGVFVPPTMLAISSQADGFWGRWLQANGSIVCVALGVSDCEHSDAVRVNHFASVPTDGLVVTAAVNECCDPSELHEPVI